MTGGKYASIFFDPIIFNNDCAEFIFNETKKKEEDINRNRINHVFYYKFSYISPSFW